MILQFLACSSIRIHVIMTNKSGRMAEVKLIILYIHSPESFTNAKWYEYEIKCNKLTNDEYSIQ